MVKYLLFIDEGGEFDKDLVNPQKGECLFGSVLLDEESAFIITENFCRTTLVEKWKGSGLRGINNMRPNDVFWEFNHATTVKQYKEDNRKDFISGVTLKILQKLKDNGAEFLVYKNKNKAKIINPEKTYLNILTEGLLDTLSDLSLKNDEPVELHVVAGGWHHGDEGLYMSLGEYRSKIDEKLSLLQAKRGDSKLSRCRITIETGNDKKESRLVVADYLSNFMFSHKGNNLYDKERSDILKLVNKPYVLSDENDDVRMAFYFDRNLYGPALLDLCYDELEQSTYNASLCRFAKLDVPALSTAFDFFIDNIKHIVTVKRDFPLTEKLLGNALKILNKLETEKAPLSLINKIKFDMYLLYETLSSHQGYYIKNDYYLKKAKECLAGMLTDIGNIDSVFIFMNRYALSKSYIFDFSEAEKICDSFEQKMEAIYQLILPEVRNEISSARDDENFTADQLARLYGTDFQIMTDLYKCGKCSYDDALVKYDKAVSYFADEPNKCRQYQYRAYLECCAGNIDEAVKYLEMGCKRAAIEEIKELGGFPQYHLSNIALKAAKLGTYKEIVDVMLSGNIPEVSEDDFNTLPYGITMLNISLIKIYRSKPGAIVSTKNIDKLYELFKKEKITFALQLLAEVVVALKKNGSKQYSDYLNKLNSDYAELLRSDYPEETKAFFKQYLGDEGTEDTEKLEKFANTRLY